MTGINRRQFVGSASTCAAHLALMSVGSPALLRQAWSRANVNSRIVAREPWGRLEQLAEGVWAMVSTPLSGDRTTLCNGGLVAGRHGVLMVEAFASDAGSEWMAAQSLALTGRAPTHVVLTHYHSDHAGGIRGAVKTVATSLHVSEETRTLITARNNNAPIALLDEAEIVDPKRTPILDLGERRVTLRSLHGHTASDLAVQVDEPNVVFCGDLVWNGMFPNFVDAKPSQLTRSVKSLRELQGVRYVPGHGTVATPDELDRYLSLLDSVEYAARGAIARGDTAEVAGAAYRIPDALGEWVLFSPRYFERAIGAWMKELAP